jgi:hypothetical protein
MVIVRPFAAEGPEHDNSHIFPAEMDSQGVDTSIPWRTHTGEEVEAHVQEELAGGSGHGSQVSGET